MATKRPSKSDSQKTTRPVESRKPKASGKPAVKTTQVKAKSAETASVKASRPKAKPKETVKPEPTTQKPKRVVTNLAASASGSTKSASKQHKPKAARKPLGLKEVPPANGKPVSNKAEADVDQAGIKTAEAHNDVEPAKPRFASKRARNEAEERISVGLFEALDDHVREHQLGRVANNARFDWGAIEDPGLEPDLAYISHDRWAPYRHVPTNLTWHVVPDLVVEIVRDGKGTSIKSWLEAYFAAGVKRVWVVFPQSLKVHDHHSVTDAKVIDRNKAIEGGDVLPGFRLELKSLGS